jgi:hypothetical protein
MVGTNHDEGFWNLLSTNKIMFVQTLQQKHLQDD